MNHKKSKNSKFVQDSYYMYGKHPVISALHNQQRKIDSIFCTQDTLDANRQIISKYKFQIMDNNALTKILGANSSHQGIVAKVHPIFAHNIETLDFSKSKHRVLILDQVTDPQNIGSIIRSAAAFEIDAIIMPQDNAPNENATIAKVAAGTLELVKIVKVVNLRSTMEYLKKQEFWIVGLDGTADQILGSNIFSNKIAIAVGAEDKGLRKLTRDTCDYLAKIPIFNKVESLNVASAASIALHLLHAAHRE